MHFALQNVLLIPRVPEEMFAKLKCEKDWDPI